LAIRRLYENRCAVCGSELRGPNGEPEIEAAHIYPKGRDGSDDVRNGIGLCRRHHWAFDVGWMTIADDHSVRVRSDLPPDEDYQFIGDFAGRPIAVPPEPALRPHALFLRAHRSLRLFEADEPERRASYRPAPLPTLLT
jgi:putative restriction endonuclease